MEGKDFNWTDRPTLFVAIVATLFSFFFFFYYTDMLMSSLFAALLSGGCVWLAYFIIRWLILSSSR